MQFDGIGLHSTSPHWSIQQREAFLQNLSLEHYPKRVLLQTCDRVELYFGVGECSEAVTRHLFRVVSGLDSPLLGEKAIQGQVKRAYLGALGEGSLSKGLDSLFQKALSVGKRVRRETGIDQGAMSHHRAVVEILKQQQRSPEKIQIFGCNALNASVLEGLSHSWRQRVTVINRSQDKAMEMALQYQCQWMSLDEWRRNPVGSDIWITALRLDGYLLTPERFPKGSGAEPLIFDLAVPRNVDPALGRDMARIWNVHDLEEHIKENQSFRRDKVIAAEAIIEEELGRYYERLNRRNPHQSFGIGWGPGSISTSRAS